MRCLHLVGFLQDGLCWLAAAVQSITARAPAAALPGNRPEQLLVGTAVRNKCSCLDVDVGVQLFFHYEAHVREGVGDLLNRLERVDAQVRSVVRVGDLCPS